VAHTIGALKRARRSERRNRRNNERRSVARRYAKKVRAAVAAKDPKAAREALAQAVQAFDKAARRRAVHPNYAARHKSQLARLVNSLK
jgi:small subunit ribosomal protein S20